MTGEYYTLHDYNLDSYDRRFAIIDTRSANDRLKDNTEFISKLQEHKNMRIVQRDDLVNDKKVNVMTPLEEKKQEKPTEDEKKGFLDRFKKDLSLYDIPHTNYLFKTYEENEVFHPDLSFIQIVNNV